MKPEKPLYGEPRNGCGRCCIEEQCLLSVEAFGPADLCPALIDTGDRYACGFIAQPDRYFRPDLAVSASMLIGKALGIGTGCDSVLTLADELAEAIVDANAA